jgi:uncharacterized protein YjbI with pentapeptide repeats
VTRDEIDPPRIAPVRLGDLVPGYAGDLEAGGSAEGLRLEATDLEGVDLASVDLRESLLLGVRAHETVLRGARLREVRLERLDAPVLDAPRSTWSEVELVASRLGSVDLHEAELGGVLVEGSRLGFVNLRGAQLRDVTFRGCRFDELDLGAARLERVAFADCTAESLLLPQARVVHLDLRGLDFAGIAGIDGLRGATVTPFQAAMMTGSLAAELGFRIAD